MVFVLDDGEKIEGCIEWYDRNAIKVRCTSSPFRNHRSSDAATREDDPSRFHARSYFQRPLRF